MSIIQRVRSNAALQAQRKGSDLLKGALPGAASGALAGVLSGQTSARQAARNLRAAGATEVVDRLNGAVSRMLQGRFPFEPPKPKANPPEPIPWTPAPLWGGLTLERYRKFFVESAMTPHAWKNLWFVSISEQQPSREAPFGVPAMNLLALDVSFAPCTLPGDVVPIGGANMDNLASTERVEVRMTTLDDERGSIERWFIGKSDQTAHADGTFGLPADYLLTVTVIQMDPTGEASDLFRMTHRWLMRPGNIDVELSRRAPELQELQMSFVQFDTFMAVP